MVNTAAIKHLNVLLYRRTQNLSRTAQMERRNIIKALCVNYMASALKGLNC